MSIIHYEVEFTSSIGTFNMGEDFDSPMEGMMRFTQSTNQGYSELANVECFRYQDGVKMERQWLITID